MAARQKSHFFSLTRRLCSTVSSPLPDQTSFSVRTARFKIRSESDPEKIVQIFQKSAESRRFRHDRAVFEVSVKKLAVLRRLDLVEQILEAQKRPPGSITEGFLTRIMMLYSKAGMIDQAVSTFHQIEELGCVRTEKSFSALLSVFLENKQFDQVHKFFAEIPKKFGIFPSIFTYNLVLKAFCEEKSLDSACLMLREIETVGIKPNVVSYNTLLSGFVREGNLVKVSEILKEMEEKGVSPDVVTYNHRILGFCKNKESSRAKELLEEMVSKEIKPSSVSFNALIDGFCKEGDLESAKKIFQGMSSNDCSPNSNAHFTLIHHVIEKGDFEFALELCKKSLNRKWVPPFTTMESLIDGLVKISKVDEAKNIVEEMKKKFSGSAADSWMKIEGALPLQMGAQGVEKCGPV